MPRPPCSVPRPGQDRPTHSPPGAGAVPATEGTPATLGSTSQAGPEAGVPHQGPDTAKATPRPMESWRKDRREGQRQVEAPGATRSPEGQPPRTVHPCSTPTSCPRGPWLGSQTDTEHTPATCSRGLAAEPRCSLCTSCFLLRLLPSGWAQRRPTCANDSSLWCVSCQQRRTRTAATCFLAPEG